MHASARPIEERLIERSTRDADTGCLRWTGPHDAKGYGQISVKGSTRRVHRVAYETWCGPIAEGMDIDHVYDAGCRHRDCIEPTHLEVVTHRENVLRATGQVTHCPQGHEYTPQNTYLHGRAHRICRTCNNARRRERYRRALAATEKGDDCG